MSTIKNRIVTAKEFLKNYLINNSQLAMFCSTFRGRNDLLKQKILLKNVLIVLSINKYQMASNTRRKT